MPKTARERPEPTRASVEPLQEGQFVGVREGAVLSRVAEITLRRWLTQKRLRRYKIGSRTLIKRDDLMALIHEAN